MFEKSACLSFKSVILLYFEKGIFRTLAYLEPEAYSEPWYVQNPGIFKTRSIFRTLVYLEPETY